MNSREKIIESIRANKPSAKVLPELPSFKIGIQELEQAFRVNANLAGSTVDAIFDTAAIATFIGKHYSTAGRIASNIPSYSGNADLWQISSPADLQDVDVAVIPSSLGIAENGAVWLTEKDSVHRILPFITQHLVIVLKVEHIIENMHLAYQQFPIDEVGFGVFIAGPSKTADIEQSLVVGAQGARSLSILLLRERE